MQQTYYCREKGGHIKKGGYRGGRGYSGWHTTWDGHVVFLRSKREFVYAIFLDKNMARYLTEQSVFKIEEENYKPDFFIYDNDYKELLKIVEVKENRKAAEPYFSFVEWFKVIGIEYEIVYDTNRIQRRWVTDEEVQQWVNNYLSAYPQFDMIGNKNPMFGVKHSEKTKTLIGKRTREYMKDATIKHKHSKALRNFWASQDGKKAKMEYAELRHDEARQRRLDDPLEAKSCEICSNEFQVEASSERTTCSASCAHKLNWRTGKEAMTAEHSVAAYRGRLMACLRTLSPEDLTIETYEAAVARQKAAGRIPSHFGMGLAVLDKYFGSLEAARKKAGDVRGAI